MNDKKLEGISDLRDESDRDGIRVVVELKRDAVPALVQNNLFKKTSLQWAFSGSLIKGDIILLYFSISYQNLILTLSLYLIISCLKLSITRSILT